MKHESVKSSQIIEQLISLRLITAYLGQRKQYGWWNCDFLDSTGIRFLETTFPRTAYAAALRSTTEAACIVHDQALGKIGSYHLFRFPPVLEDQIEHGCDKLDWTESFRQISSHESAMEALKTIAGNFVKAPTGPVQVGVVKRILTSTSIQELAAHYHSAFQDSIRCFPYFAPGENER